MSADKFVETVKNLSVFDAGIGQAIVVGIERFHKPQSLLGVDVGYAMHIGNIKRQKIATESLNGVVRIG